MSTVQDTYTPTLADRIPPTAGWQAVGVSGCKDYASIAPGSLVQERVHGPRGLARVLLLPGIIHVVCNWLHRTGGGRDVLDRVEQLHAQRNPGRRGDRLHPSKRNRPVPSGRIRLPVAYGAVLLGVAGLGLASLINWPFFWTGFRFW